jgi:DNA primase
MKAALRSAPLFAAHNLDVRVIALPAEDDPDTFIKRLGAPAFEAAINAAKLLAQYRLEQAVAPFNWTILTERKNAVRAGAQVIAEAPNATERDAYVIWLAAQWAHAENVTEPDRLRMLEDAVRSDVRQILRKEQKQTRYSDEEASPESQQDILEENAAATVSKGVLGAQKELLGVLIGNPSWRNISRRKCRWNNGHKLNTNRS